MTTITAITLTQETLEETTIKMMVANKNECLENKEESLTKYLKLAINLRNKAYKHIEENKEEVLELLKFSLNKEEK